MDAIGDVGNNVHVVDDVEFFVFSSSLRGVETYNEVLFIIIWWVHSKLYFLLKMSQCQQIAHGYITNGIHPYNIHLCI